MSRFLLSKEAERDLDGIIAYVQALPEKPGLKLGKALQQTMHLLADYPHLGAVHKAYSLLSGEEIRRFVTEDYLFFYAPERRVIVFTAILHGRQDIDPILRRRLG
jgi:plasmid stabilization system protein ParE